jgi:hypothetical protein
VRGGARPGNLLRNRMSSIQPAQITSIYRYPGKGLSSQPLPSVALARNSSSSTIASPSWRPISTKPAAIAIRSCGGEMEALRTERASAKLAKSADKTLREAQAANNRIVGRDAHLPPCPKSTTALLPMRQCQLVSRRDFSGGLGKLSRGAPPINARCSEVLFFCSGPCPRNQHFQSFGREVNIKSDDVSG